MSVYGRPVTGCLAVLIQACTIEVNSSLLIPECVFCTIVRTSSKLSLSICPLNTSEYGLVVFQSGWLAACSLIWSSINKIWKYIGFSDHNVPSLSKVAIRSWGATKLGELASVTSLTNWIIACLVWPSFHEGNGSLFCAKSGNEITATASVKTFKR